MVGPAIPVDVTATPGSSLPVTAEHRSRGGFVLPMVLLCLLTLTAVAHGAFALARHQGFAGRAAVATVQARLASEGAVRVGVAQLDGTARHALRRGEAFGVDVSLPEPRVTARAEVERIRPEWLLVEGSGRVAGKGLEARRTIAALYWSLEGEARVAALRAGLEHGGLLAAAHEATLLGSDPVGAPEDWPSTVCSPDGAVLDSLLGPVGLPATATFSEAVVEASGGGRPGSGLAGVPRLGLLDGSRLQELATVHFTTGPVTPGPVEAAGGCATHEVTNWGSPDEPEGVCGDHWPLLVTSGDLLIEGGQGQGVLVVGGDLTMTGSARFVGMVLVAGSLRVEAGARLQGAARVRERVVVGGRIEASPCAVLRALRARPDLSRPLPAPGGGWIPIP